MKPKPTIQRMTTEKSRGKQRTEKLSRIGVDVNQLRWTCSDDVFDFKTTAELQPLNEIIGQERAMKALRFGAELQAPGYNIFVGGLRGTGRLTTIQQILSEVEQDNPRVFDYAYAYNFADADSPIMLRFEKGQGKEFVKSVDSAISNLKRRIPQLFEEDRFKRTRNEIIETYRSEEKILLDKFDEKLRPNGFVLGHAQDEEGNVQPEIFPVINGHPVLITALDEEVQKGTITTNDLGTLQSTYLVFKSELNSTIQSSAQLFQDFQSSIIEHDSAASSILVRAAFEDVSKRFTSTFVSNYLRQLERDIIDHIGVFAPGASAVPGSADTGLAPEDAVEKFTQYQINLVLDNSLTKSQPVVIETVPTLTNLFGAIERKTDKTGVVRSTFMNIKAGSLLRADGGYLILNALDLLEDASVWQMLKRVLLYRRMEIASADPTGMFPTLLKPENIKLNLKVIFLGDTEIYNNLYAIDDDFKKMFKVLSEFDTEITSSKTILRKYARFIAKICFEEKLSHLTKSGVSAVVEWSARQAGTKDKVTLQFSDVADIVRESAYMARLKKAKYVTREHVETAVRERYRRTDLMDEKIKEGYLNKSLLIDVRGSRVGQINGLTVYTNGLISFGKPARITVTVGAGNKGVLNIEREVELSGSLHNKGVLILTGILNERFSQRRPIALTASIAFEQSYGEIDGDSATAAEFVTMVSAITSLPVSQALAITGSINQKGDIQPIGGVNEKVTGFFEICQARGLTGKQGVVLPRQNLNDLMLPHIVVDAVKNGKFHIYAITKIEEAIELMLDKPAGTPNSQTKLYPKGTVFEMVDTRLDELYRISRQVEFTRTIEM